MRNGMDCEDLLSASEVAQFLNVSYRTVMWWIQEKKIPSYRLGRHVRVRRNDLLEWVETRRSNPIN